MSQAKVDSIDSLKLLKVALIKFGEGANLALMDAESDLIRTMNWLENEQTSYWQGQFRKRTELVSRCKEAVRMKQIFKDSSGRQQSAVEEQKALKNAMRKLEEADVKIKAVKKAIAKLEREIQLYKGSVQRFATDVLVDVPAAAAQLEGFLTSLAAYTGLTAPSEVTSAAPVGSSASIGAVGTQSMARTPGELEKEKVEPPSDEAKIEESAKTD